MKIIWVIFLQTGDYKVVEAKDRNEALHFAYEQYGVIHEQIVKIEQYYR